MNADRRWRGSSRASVARRVPGPMTCCGMGDLASQHAQLVAEHRDRCVLVILVGPQREETNEAAYEQEHDRRAHIDDLAKPASWLLAGEILWLYPSGRTDARECQESLITPGSEC
jgi:predicted nuclease with RNAse H fold